eukprot:scaffold65690_cov29-Tisochrysis_lutea.AAC.5
MGGALGGAPPTRHSSNAPLHARPTLRGGAVAATFRGSAASWLASSPTRVTVIRGWRCGAVISAGGGSRGSGAEPFSSMASDSEAGSLARMCSEAWRASPTTMYVISRLSSSPTA